MTRLYFRAWAQNGHSKYVPLPDAAGLVAITPDGHAIEMVTRGDDRPVEITSIDSLVVRPRVSNSFEVDVDRGSLPYWDDHVVEPQEQKDLAHVRSMVDEALAASGRKRTEILERLALDLKARD